MRTDEDKLKTYSKKKNVKNGTNNEAKQSLTLLKNGFMRMIRKGGHEDRVPLNVDVIKYLSQYKEQRGRKPDTYFFCNHHQRMHHKTIYKLVKKCLFFADLKGSPHSVKSHII